MEFLIKKDGSGKTTASINDIIKLLDLGNLNKFLRESKATINALKSQPKLEKKEVLELIVKERDSILNTLKSVENKIVFTKEEVKSFISEDLKIIKRLKKEILDLDTKLNTLVKENNKKENNDNSDKFLKIGDIINIIRPASIEKDKNIPEGTIYYNKTKNTIRLKTKNKWVSLKFE